MMKRIALRVCVLAVLATNVVAIPKTPPTGEVKAAAATDDDADGPKPGPVDGRKAGPSGTWQQTDKSLALLRDGKVLWQLNYDKAEGKPYFHPLTAGGEDLTALRPKDHPWHRAMWFSWKFINGLNYWEEDRKTGLSQGLTDLLGVKVAPAADGSATIVMALSYHPPGKPAVLTEKRLIAVTAPDDAGRYSIDCQSTFTAGAAEVKLDRTPIRGEKGGKGYGGYAGLSLRMAASTRGWKFLDSEGRADAGIHGQPARWVCFAGKTVAGKLATVAMFDHTGNLNHPSPWYISTGMPYFSPAILFNKAHTLPAGKSLTLRHRVLITSGSVSADEMNRQWKAFVAPRP